MSPGDLQLGVVVEFDQAKGLGMIGPTDVAFHSTAITDGTRTIAIGTSVGFIVGPGGPGRWEARQVRTLFEGNSVGEAEVWPAGSDHAS